MTLKWLISVACFALLLSPAADAQDRGVWPSERFNPPAPANIAGQFDYYSLVLSWSPTYCSGASQPDPLQCNRNDGRRFGFVLDGLWPATEKGYLEDCRLRRKPYVPQTVIEAMLDVMPSPSQVAQEYRSHGTCSGLTPEAYFQLMRNIYRNIQIPERYANSFETEYRSPQDIIIDFLRTNPQIKPGMISVACGGAANKLKEVHICFSKNGQIQPCGSNEEQARICPASRIMVPPVRSTARGDQFGSHAQPSPLKQTPIPRPRLIEGPNGN